MTGIIECDSSTLEFQPDEVVSAREIDIAIGRLSKLCHELKSDFNLMIKAGGQLSRAELADMLYKSLKKTPRRASGEGRGQNVIGPS